MSVIGFESLQFALESTAGTAESAPTHAPNLKGSLTPSIETEDIKNSYQILTYADSTVQTASRGKWEAKGALSSIYLPIFLESSFRSGITASTPTTGVYLRDYTPVHTLSEFDSSLPKSMTLWHYMPGLDARRAAYGTVEKWEFTGEAQKTAQFSASGMTKAVSTVTNPTSASNITSPIFRMQDARIYFDTSSAIGTTLLDAIVQNVTISWDRNYTYQPAIGVSDYAFTTLGNTPKLEGKMVLYFTNDNVYTPAVGVTMGKLRIALYSDTIASTYKHSVIFDIYTPLRFQSWGEADAAKRTMEVSFTALYSATPATEVKVSVQNNRSSL